MSDGGDRISGRLYSASGAVSEVVVEKGMAAPATDQLLWIDVERNEDDLRVVGDALGWRNGIPALSRPATRPRVVKTPEWTRISVLALEKEPDHPRPIAVDLVAGLNVVVSVHDMDLDRLGMPLDAIVAGAGEFGALDESAFVAALLDALLAGYFRAVERIEGKIDDYDERALRSRLNDDLIGDLVGLRRQIAVLRRALNPQREVFYTLERPGLVLGDSESAAWPQIGDRFRQAVEAVENARELLVGTFDIVMSRSSERTNDVMRVLTVVSAVLLPAIVIAGVMGMNFKPSFFDDPTNFVVVVAMMLLLSVGILLFARYKRWI